MRPLPISYHILFYQVKGDDSSLWMPVGDIPPDMTASEYYPQEELIFGGRSTDQSDKIKEFISRCKYDKILALISEIDVINIEEMHVRTLSNFPSKKLRS